MKGLMPIEMGLPSATQLRRESKSGPKDSNVIILYLMLPKNKHNHFSEMNISVIFKHSSKLGLSFYTETCKQQHLKSLCNGFIAHILTLPAR